MNMLIDVYYINETKDQFMCSGRTLSPMEKYLVMQNVSQTNGKTHTKPLSVIFVNLNNVLKFVVEELNQSSLVN